VVETSSAFCVLVKNFLLFLSVTMLQSISSLSKGIHMSNVSKDPAKKPEQIALLETLFVRFVITSLSAFVGFILVLLGYGFISFFDLDSEEFSKYPFVYFGISIALWIMIGLVNPYAYFKSFIEELRGSTVERIIVFIVVPAIFVILYWYILTFLEGTIVSVFGIE